MNSMPYPPQPGWWVTIRGGFEDGLEGFVISTRKHVSQDYLVFEIQTATGFRLGGFGPASYEVQMTDVCPYCGREECHGSPLTANGADIDRFYRHHPRERQVRVATEADGYYERNDQSAAFEDV